MMKRLPAFRIIVMLLLTAAASAAGTEASKLAVPSADQQADARQVVEHRYRDFLADTQPANRLATANMLLDASRLQYNNPSWRYAMADAARRLAVEAHDLNAADTACRELAKHFDIKLGALRLQTLHEADQARQGGGDTPAIIYMAMNIVDDALRADDFATAQDALQLADTLGHDTGDPELAQDLAARKDQLSAQKAEHAKIAPALATLADHPDDPQANLAAGKYICFIRGDWAAGLPMLAEGSDKQLQAAAKLDLGNPDTCRGQVAVGNQWFDLANSGGNQSDQIQLRSAYWYQKAEPSATGLTAKLLSTRLKDLKPILAKRGGLQGLWFAILNAVHNKTYQDSDIVGGAAAPSQSEEVPNSGALLIGLRVGRATYNGNPTVGFFQAIYLTSAGETFGDPVGTLEGDPVILKAKPGYAVGAIKARGGAGMDALTCTFMRIDGNQLDPTTAYVSDTVGGDGGNEMSFDGKGTPIIGIQAKQDPKWVGFGVVYLSAVHP
jgi:hypothetical protein